MSHTEPLRAMLTSALDDEELNTLCYDHFRAVHHDFSAGMTRAQKISLLIQHCDTHNAWADLFAHLPEHATHHLPADYPTLTHLRQAVDPHARLTTLPTAAIPDPAPLPRGSRMLHLHNPRFVGREADLLALARTFTGGTTTQAIAAAATGMGGIGKTQLASEFVHRYGHYFAGGVFWLSFDNSASIPAEIAQCGGPGHMDLAGISGLPIDEQVQRVHTEWCSELPRLLVFDNCEEIALLHEWQPKSGGCRILLTSRNPTWDEMPGVHTLPLDVLAREESVALLRGLCGAVHPHPNPSPIKGEGLPSAAPLPSVVGDDEGNEKQSASPAAALTPNPSPWGRGASEHPSPTGRRGQGDEGLHEAGPLPDDAVFDALAAELGDLPLALHLAGSYLHTFRDDITPAEYLEELHTERVLSHESLRGKDVTISYTKHDLNVEITFRKSYEKLDPATPLNEQARALLARMACVAPGEPFPRDLLLHTADITDDKKARRQATRAINRLTSLGLLDVEADGALRMHRLLAHFVQQTAPDDTAQAAVEQTMLETAREMNNAGDPRPLLVLQPHLRHITDTAEPRGDEQAASLCNTLGYHLDTTGDYAGAKPYYARALAIREAVLGASHPNTAQILNNLGSLLQAMGDLAGAKPYYARALAIWEAVLGASHPDTATSLNNMGYLLQDMGDLAGAKPYYACALAIKEEVLGASHPDTATSLNNLGSLLQAMGDLAGAKPYVERALAIREEVLGASHPDTALSLNNMGYLLQDMGDLAGAKPYLERALAIREAVLGATHPDTASSLNNLGMLLKAMGDLVGAKPYLERALAIWEAVLGASHPDTASSLNNLGMLLKAMGDLAGAKPYLERALAIREAVLGASHPDTATSLNNMGGLLKAMGDLAGAKPYYARALAIREEVLGASHPDTALSLNNMGLLLQAMGDLAGAKPYYARALAIWEEVLGASHPHTATSLNNMGGLLKAMGDLAGAKPYYARALAISEDVLGASHPDTASSLNNLGGLLQDMGDLAGAKPYFARALATFTAALGVDHPHTKVVRGNLERLVQEMDSNRAE